MSAQHRTGAEQHRRRGSRRPADEVHAPVHAVGEVHVDVAGRTEHDRSAGCLATEGMRAGVVLAGVRLDFGESYGDVAFGRASYDDSSQQVTGNGEDRAVVEGARQNAAERGQRDVLPAQEVWSAT